MTHGIALGFGNNIDYELVWDSGVIEALIRQHDIQRRELDAERPIRCQRDLLISILRFAIDAGGGERDVASSDIIEDFARHFALRKTLGGTAVRAAIAMRLLGCRPAMHLVTINDDARRLLPADCPFVCSNAQDSFYPHLIVQFDQGARIQAGDIDIRVSAPNRLIYHCNHDNKLMKINEDFGELAADARVMLVSGFNAVRSQSLLNQRMDAVQRILNRLPRGALVYCENADNFAPGCFQLLYGRLRDQLHILGMNEDELQTLLQRRVDALDPEQMARALSDLQSVIDLPIIVVHSRHWALAYGRGARRFSKALEIGSRLATARFCHGDALTLADFRRIERLPAKPENAAFANAIRARLPDKIACAPVADVAASGATTIGLGDAFVGGFLAALASDRGA